jgi:hypothetical protein
MAHIEENNECCAVREIGGLIASPTARAALQVVGPRLVNRINQCDVADGHASGHVMFTQAGEEFSYGIRFAAYLRRHRLGTIVATRFNMNPNSGRGVKVWMWQPHLPNLIKWIAKEKLSHLLINRGEPFESEEERELAEDVPF